MNARTEYRIGSGSAKTSWKPNNDPGLSTRPVIRFIEAFLSLFFANAQSLTSCQREAAADELLLSGVIFPAGLKAGNESCNSPLINMYIVI